LDQRTRGDKKKKETTTIEKRKNEKRYERDQEDMKRKIKLETRSFFNIEKRREETTRSSTLQTKTC
jgi:hypothetical protein